MLVYYFSKRYSILEYNVNNLAKLTNELKQIIHAEEKDISDKVMTCINTIPFTSNTLHKLLLNEILHSSYLQRKLEQKVEIIIKIFSSYVEPLLKDINHTTLLQKWKMNLNSAAYETKLILTCIKLIILKIDRYDSNFYWPTLIRDKMQWLHFSQLWSILQVF